MEFTCEKCGWLAYANGVCICGYSGRPTTRNDSCMAWKTSIVTNADHIRMMNDNELANFLIDDFCELLCGSPASCDGKCKEKTLEWLRQEV